MKSIRCIFGIHDWIYHNNKRNRTCWRCLIKQKILPGHGGGEPWCWLDDGRL